MTSLTFRGTGDSSGVPRVYCDCPVCEEARSPGNVNRRLRSALQMSDRESGVTWIDCGPDWGRQMEAAGLRGIDRMLITHPHFDHIGGLTEWYDTCRWTGNKGIAYAASEVIEVIMNRFPWLDRQIEFRPFDEPISFGKWSVRSWRVNHGRNGYSYAFRFDHTETGSGWVYCPDAIDLTEEQQQPIYGADLLILGTSFYKEPYEKHTRSVYDVAEACELVQKWRPKRTILTHMSHDIHERHGKLLPDGISLAYTGLTVTV